MNNTQNNGSEAQGAKDQPLAEPTLAQVEKWVKDDLARSLSFLQAIHSDPNAIRAVSVHFHGLASNYFSAKQSVKKVEEEVEE